MGALAIWNKTGIGKVKGWQEDVENAELAEEHHSMRSEVDYTGPDEESDEDHLDQVQRSGDQYSHFCFDYLWAPHDGCSARDCLCLK